jgi:hypothetical protein
MVYFEELTYKNATGLCPQKVCGSIEYFKELTYRNATGLCSQFVCGSMEYFEALTYKHGFVSSVCTWIHEIL